MKNAIIAMTDNSYKMDEYRKVFNLYGIIVIQKQETDKIQEIKNWFKSCEQNILFAFREMSNIYNKKTNLISQQEHLETVINKAVLDVYFFQENDFHRKTYSHSIEGYIDIAKQSKEEDVFGWDDVFVNKHLQKSYHELKSVGLKTSARDLVISDLLKEFVYYKNRIDLNHQPQKQFKSIDFSNLVSDFVQKNEYLTNPKMVKYHLDELLANVVNSGLFFKSAKNRREKNYWLPGLNAGIPLVPKKDPIHEISFMFHDFTHFLMPDLIYDGVDNSLNKKVYILYRMMSEAVSLCIADMLFVDTLSESSYSYDFSLRKIYPLFKDLDLDLTNHFEQDLKRLLYANVHYALDGNDQYFKELIRHKDFTNLEAYKKKYEKFFVEDYKWTAKNFDNMAIQKNNITRWLEDIQPLSKASGIEITTIGSFIKKFAIKDANSKELIDNLFENVFHSIVLPQFNKSNFIAEMETKQAFIRYLMGQFGLFSKYYFLEEAAVYKKHITDYVTKHYNTLSFSQIQTILSFFQQFIELLEEKCLISFDDAETYKEIYTIFVPFYVFYDAKKEMQPNIKEIQKQLLK